MTHLEPVCERSPVLVVGSGTRLDPDEYGGGGPRRDREKEEERGLRESKAHDSSGDSSGASGRLGPIRTNTLTYRTQGRPFLDRDQ